MAIYPIIESIPGVEYVFQVFGAQSTSLLPLTQFLNLLSLSTILYVPEEDPNYPSLSSEGKEDSWWYHVFSSNELSVLVYSTPILLVIYYSLFLLWIVLYPSFFSFGFLIFVLVDIVLCKQSNRSMKRQDAIRTLLECEGTDSDATLNSFSSRLIILPNLLWRNLTLWYCLLVQLNSFFGSVSFCYFIGSERALVALFGNHIGDHFSFDRYAQLIIMILLYIIQLVLF